MRMFEMATISIRRRVSVAGQRSIGKSRLRCGALFGSRDRRPIPRGGKASYLLIQEV